MKKTATISECGTYRYRLGRVWDECLPTVVFVMLNPSTADADLDDPTIRRCCGFAKAWGYGGIEVVNLFGLRATNPDELRRHPDPIGHLGTPAIGDAVIGAPLVVAAWGTHGALYGRGAKVRRLIGEWGGTLHHLGLTKDGHPRHPLYLRGDTEPTRWTA